MLLAAQPELVTPVLQVAQRVLTRHLLALVGLKADEGHGDAVTLIQRFGSAANLNPTCTAWCWTACTRARRQRVDPVEEDAPTDDKLHALLQTVIT